MDKQAFQNTKNQSVAKASKLLNYSQLTNNKPIVLRPGIHNSANNQSI